MIICFDVSTDAKRSLDNLLGTGQFRDQSEAISTALVNYEIIHSSVSAGDQVVMHGEPSQISENAQAKPTPGKQTASIISVSEVPELFRLGDAIDNLALPDVPSLSVEKLPPAQWFFGQYNKFLPVKATCRALYNLLQRTPTGVPIAEAMETISGAACVLGDHLNALDRGSNRHRDDAFAVAFPSTSSGGPGSKIRFANQFIGDLRLPKHVEGHSRQSKINGLPSAMKFIVCSEGKSPLLGLTKPGADFALLQNPILDGVTVGSSTQKFNEAEVGFLVAHIRHAVPEEAAAYTAIITAIGEGANSPDKVDKFLCHHFQLQVVPKAEKEHQITQTFLTTQRTGAISRMVELGLITRLREGLRVTYQISNTGQNFIDGLSIS